MGVNNHSIAVPEWGVTIYWRPPSEAMCQRILKRAKGRDSRAAAAMLQELARDSAGRRLFAKGRAELANILHRVDGDITKRVAVAMFETGAAAAGVKKGGRCGDAERAEIRHPGE